MAGRNAPSSISKFILTVIGLLAAQLAYSDSHPIVQIDPATQIVSGTPTPGQWQGFNEYQYDGMIGWTFSLQQPLTITQVGWYDDGKDGLSRPFQIGLWQDLTDYFAPKSAPTQLLGDPDQGITIPTGTTASLEGSWRVVNLTEPLNLVPGYYELLGLDSASTPDVLRYAFIPDQSPSTAPGLSIQQFVWFPPSIDPANNPPGFHAMDNSTFYLADGLELGPMLFTDVPEPSSLSALSVGLTILFARRISSTIHIKD